MCRLMLAVMTVSLCAHALAAVVPLHVANPLGRTVDNWPITTGVPFPAGALRSADHVRVLDEAGREVPCQALTTSVYPDGSVRWLLLDLQADVPARGRELQLEYGDTVARAAPPQPIVLEQTPQAINLSTGPLSLSVRRDRGNFLDELTVNGVPVVQPGHDGGPYFVDDQGQRFRAALDSAPEVEVELAGPLRSVITVRGWYVGPAGERKCRFITRLHAFAGQPFVRVFYTWIMTEDSRTLRFRDIGLRLPLPAQSCSFALDDGSAVSFPVTQNLGADLVQYDFDKFLLRPGQPREGGPQPLGVMATDTAATTVALAVRDFRQLFPKELSSDAEGITFHVWPAHGLAQPDRPVTDAMLQYLWFCHEGEVLDFQVPESYYTHSEQYSEYEYRYVRSSQYANAMGISKTHELLLAFGSQLDAARVAAVTEVFQDPPECLAAPQWMCASGVFGHIAPVDRESFPTYEDLISGTFDAERRMQDFTRDYGMWNFGDAHTSWDMTRRRWSDVYRCWRNTHHGAPRLPWILYVRSGDPKYLRFGVRNTRHVMDEDFCHWSTPEFEALPYPQGKIRGALNDYKGLVHWHSGTRLTDYNSMTDFMLWYWHLTGDRRGLEVAQQWGDAVVQRYAQPFGHREGAGTCAALLELYKDTLDERYLKVADDLARHLISTQKDDGSFPQWENYAPWLERYCELTGSEQGKAALVRWANAYYNGYGDSFSDYKVGGELNILSYAYLYSGDLKYLARGQWLADSMVASVYRGEDELLRGLMLAGQTSLSGYGIQRLPHLLYALKQYGRPIEPDMVLAGQPGFALLFRRTRPELDGQPTKIETVEAWILEETDTEFTVTLNTRHTYDERRYFARITAPDGAEVLSVDERVPRGAKQYVFTVPADDKTGVYRVSLGGVGSFGQVSHPVQVQPALPVAFPLEGRIFTRDPGAYYLYVPAGVTRFALALHVFDQATCTGQVVSPDDEQRVQFSAGPNERLSEVCEVRPMPDQTGAAWRLNIGGANCLMAVTSEGATIPPLLFQEAYPAQVCKALTASMP